MQRVVLVRPRGPRNVGSIVRLAANFGPTELALVQPQRPSLLVHPDFEQMAHGVDGLGAGVRVAGSLEEALADCTWSYGFTARARDHRRVHDWREVRAGLALRCRSDGERVALVFGNEESGLSGAEAAPLGELVRIPTAPEHGSLNLALAVGIVLSTVFFEEAPPAEAPQSSPVTGAERRFLVERLKDALGGCTRSEPARRDLVAAIERVFSRAPLETRDARAWHLLARALGGEGRPADYGLELSRGEARGRGEP